MNPELLLAHEAFLRALVRGLVADASTADDVVQETYRVALARSPSVVRSVRGFLARCARSVVIDRRRADARRSRREERGATRESVPSAEQIAEREQARRLVVDAVLALEEPYRTAILMRFDRGMAPREIARTLGVPVETARTRVKRGIERLRARLDHASHGDRGSWCALLMPLAARPEGLLVMNLGAAVGGAMIMKWWISVAAGLVLACGAIFLWQGAPDTQRGQESPETAQASPAAPAAVAQTGPDSETRRDEEAAALPRGGQPRPAETDDSRAVEGVVVDLADRPIAGAQVAAWSDLRDDAPAIDALPPAGPEADLLARIARATSGADGTFRIAVDRLEAPFGVLAAAGGFAPSTEHGVRTTERVKLVLEPPRALSGRVLDLRGHPVEGADVTWSGLVGGALLAQTARSDAEGTYRLAPLPAASARIVSGRKACGWIEVRRDGFAPLLVEPEPVSIAIGEARMDLVLADGVALSVRVIDAGTRAPIAGAIVELRSDEGEVEHPEGEPWRQSPFEGRPLGSARSSAMGVARFEHVPSLGFHESTLSTFTEKGGIIAHVVARCPGFADGKADVLAFDDGEQQSIDIALTAVSSVEGRVVDAAGRGVAGALVTDEPGILRYDGIFADSVRMPRTDADGRYTLLVPAAPRGAAREIEIGARREHGVELATVRVTLNAQGKVSAPDLRLGSAPAAIVIVVDTAGRAVPGALVSREDRAAPQSTDAGGRAVVEFGAVREARVHVRARGFAPATSEAFAPMAPAPVLVTVRLETAHAVTGIVRFEDGAPAAGAEIDLLAVGEPASSLFCTSVASPKGPREVQHAGRARARADGRFTLRDLPSGPFVLGARASGIGSTDRRRTSLAVFAEQVMQDAPETVLTLPGIATGGDGVALIGRVRDATSGDAVTRVTATLVGERGSFAGEVFAPGEFRMKDVPAGVYLLTVRGKGWLPAEVEGVRIAEALPADPPVLEIAMSRGATLHGAVRKSDGSPLADALVNFAPENGANPPVWGRVDSDGNYSVSGLPPGRYRPGVQFSIRYPGVEAFAVEREMRVDIAPTAHEISFDIRLEPAGTIRIEVTSASLPPRGENVTATAEQLRESARSFVEVRSADGAVIQRITRLTSGGSHWIDVRPGEYVVTASIDGVEERPRRVTVAARRTEEIRFGS